MAIKEFGVFKGTFIAAKRILRCNPKGKCGYDPIPYNIKGDLKWLI
jgi:putative component of membrane protein insertase Oxa1/YidC/SpoIIIJ protein YidD